MTQKVWVGGLSEQVLMDYESHIKVFGLGQSKLG